MQKFVNAKNDTETILYYVCFMDASLTSSIGALLAGTLGQWV